MKKIKYIILFILLVFPLTNVYASGSVSVNKSSVSITVGSSYTIKVSASNAAGRVDISSSNSSVASVSTSSAFLDNSSVSVKIKGKKEGSATISIKLTDVATYDGKVLSGTKTVKVTVKKAAAKTTTTKVEAPKVMNITKFDIVGYDLDFNIDKHDYLINISPKVNKIFLLIEGTNYKTNMDKTIDITDLDELKISLSDDTTTKDYIIKINRVVDKEIITKIKEITNKTYIYTTIGLGVLSFILLIILLIEVFKRRKDKLGK